MLVLFTVWACQQMEQPGHMFQVVTIGKTEQMIATDTEQADSTGSLEKDVAIDPLFVEPQEEIILGRSTETGVENSHTDETNSPDSPTNAAVSETQIAVPQEEPRSIPPQPAQATLQPLYAPSVRDGWRPTLISSVMEGPNPRAILAMPNGKEIVVKAGDLLSEDGVVVMSIGAKYVELAVISGAEGRAKIENITLISQF